MKNILIRHSLKKYINNYFHVTWKERTQCPLLSNILITEYPLSSQYSLYGVTLPSAFSDIPYLL